MWHRIRCSTVALVLVAATLASAGARADGEATTSDDSAALRERGNTAMKSGRPADALEAYKAVYAQTHDPALLYNIARAEQALTDYPHAEDHLRQFKQVASPELIAKVPGLDALIAEVALHVHTLTLHGGAPGGEVRLGGRVVGTTPLVTPLRVNAGTTDLEVRTDGFVPFRRRLDLQGGAASTVDITLVRLDNSGVLFVRSPQAGAHVDIDGEPIGNVPVEVRVQAGAHVIRVSQEGFNTSESKAVVAAGERKEMQIDLAGKPSILTRWWFWTGVGVVVAGSVISYIALTTEKGAPMGSIPPGQVSLGLRY